ncbi:MAG TPA: hypothetical protein DD733_07555 [Clostridiales bacterium]|nr:hypothetical protein [Clostridiales bacterium]
MAVAADYMDGNTHIIIRDDYCVKTKEEVDKVLDRISEIYVRIFTNQAIADSANQQCGNITKKKGI